MISSLQINLLKSLRYVLNYSLDLSIKICLKIEILLGSIDKKITREIHSNPTFMQYANRLIEFIDARFIAQVYVRFENLVRSGVSPDHAFVMVTHAN